MKMKYLLAAVLLLITMTGCTARTVEELYCPPKRSEDYEDLQSAIDRAMNGLQYCAPLSGENRQAVQQADLNGDGVQEYLVFTKSSQDKPLQILIFRRENGEYTLWETIDSTGSAFDQVEYVRMDSREGVELVVGRQVSDQILRSVSVYSFSAGQAEKLLSSNYSKFLTADMDRDGRTELMILRPGQTETENGVAELYGVKNDAMERFTEASMSGPVDRLKRVITGTLSGGTPAVFVATTVGESAIITDVYALVDGVFTNVSFSNESGTSVQTLRNYFVYADDIDDDTEVELPDLITMHSTDAESSAQERHLIRWYALTPTGEEITKMYTFHNYVGGWYLRLDAAWAERISVKASGNAYEFHLWNTEYTQADKIFTVYAFTGQDREEQAISDNRFVLHRDEYTTYAAYMEVASGSLSMSQEDLINGFRLIRQDWKTGET